jgi:hypothetical protein
MKPVAYSYDAALHCACCARVRFTDLDNAIDCEGNQISAVYSHQVESGNCCDDCLEIIE